MVTDDTFVNFLHCRRKAFLRAAGIRGEPADIETVLLDMGRVYRQRALAVFLAPHPVQDVVRDPPCLQVALKSRPPVIVDMTATADGISSRIEAAELIKGGRNPVVYAPVLFVPNEKVSRSDKLLLAFNALALSLAQGVVPPTGKVVYGSGFRVLKCKIQPLVSEVRHLVTEIRSAQATKAVPRVTLNRHCNSCEFRVECQKVAEQSDDLSLLRGLSENEIEKQRNRGVTTLTQFAFSYRPGRRGKRNTGKARKHDHSLQAVALRDKKIYVLDNPTVPRSRVALYLDVEGIPDRNFDYLIGLVAVVDGRHTTHSFGRTTALRRRRFGRPAPR